MSTKADTEHKKYYFKPSEYVDGTPFISTEPINGELEGLKDKALGFSLPEGTSHQRALQIAKFLNDNIETISITTFWEE